MKLRFHTQHGCLGSLVTHIWFFDNILVPSLSSLPYQISRNSLAFHRILSVFRHETTFWYLVWFCSVFFCLPDASRARFPRPHSNLHPLLFRDFRLYGIDLHFVWPSDAVIIDPIISVIVNGLGMNAGVSLFPFLWVTITWSPILNECLGRLSCILSLYW